MTAPADPHAYHGTVTITQDVPATPAENRGRYNETPGTPARTVTIASVALTGASLDELIDRLGGHLAIHRTPRRPSSPTRPDA